MGQAFSASRVCGQSAVQLSIAQSTPMPTQLPDEQRLPGQSSSLAQSQAPFQQLRWQWPAPAVTKPTSPAHWSSGRSQ
jgi:hypothetical protein